MLNRYAMTPRANFLAMVALLGLFLLAGWLEGFC